VPWRLVGSDVWLRVTDASLEAYADDVRVATHTRRGSGLYSTCEEHLPQHRADLRHRSCGYWEECAVLLGEEVLKPDGARAADTTQCVVSSARQPRRQVP
jgi:hypothetical protein